MDSTKPASRSTRRCLDTIGCGMPSCRSISPTDCCDETRRLNIARRFGSAMISNTDSILLAYSAEHIRVKVYKGRGPRQRFQSACGDAPSDAFLAGAIQSAALRGIARDAAVAVAVVVVTHEHVREVFADFRVQPSPSTRGGRGQLRATSIVTAVVIGTGVAGESRIAAMHHKSS